MVSEPMVIDSHKADTFDFIENTEAQKKGKKMAILYNTDGVKFYYIIVQLYKSGQF